MSETSRKNPLLEGILKLDGEVISATLETGRQALNAWEFDPENWNYGIVCEVNMALSKLYPYEISDFLAEHMQNEVSKTHERVSLVVTPETVNMVTKGRKSRLFRTATIRFQVK